MTAGLGYWASNEFFDQTTASRKFRRPFARSMTASVQHRRIQTLPKPFDLLPEPPIANPAIRATSRSTGAVPKAGFNELVPELDVSDLQASLRFWCGLLGFEVAYDRPAARFAYLVRGHIQIMLCERNGNWEVGELSPPFGRGVNFQMTVSALDPILTALEVANWPLFRQPNDAWYRTGDREGGQREFLVQDPDGYVLRFAQDIGTRPLTEDRT
jgi:catechol 2,3-dioxygenase-like lactoylglutathione lyase family enzyme